MIKGKSKTVQWMPPVRKADKTMSREMLMLAVMIDETTGTTGKISSGKTTFLTRLGTSKMQVVERDIASARADQGSSPAIRYRAKVEVLASLLKRTFKMTENTKV